MRKLPLLSALSLLIVCWSFPVHAFLCIQVPASIAVSPSSVDFGTVFVGSSSARSFTVTYTCRGNLANPFCTHTCYTPNTASITLAGIPSGYAVSPSSFTAVDGSPRTVQVTFQPTSESTSSGNITVNTTIGSAQTVSITGNGYQPRPGIHLSWSSQDFGSVTVGNTGSRMIQISNSGDATLTGSFSVGSPFSVSPNSFSIGAGEVQNFTVNFSPGSEGTATTTLFVYSNDPNGTRTASLQGFGYVPRPVIDIQPTSLSFGVTSLGDSLNRSVVIRNTGDATLLMRDLSVTGPFSLSPTGLSDIAPGGSSTVAVTFRPVSRGPASGQLSIRSVNPFNSNTIDTWIVNLDGGAKAPQISISTLNYDFGPVPVGDQDFKDFSVTNDCYGNCTDGYSDSLSVTQIASTLGDFTIVPTSLTLSMGETKTFRVFFTPTVNGTRSTNLTLTSNDPLSPSKTMAIQGTGLTPAISLSSLSLSHGSVRVGQSTSSNLTISNTGHASLSVHLSSPSSPFSINSLSATLAPGQNRQFAVTFSPGGANNYASQTIVTSNDPTAPSLTVDLSGVGVTPEIDISPTCPDAPALGGCQTLDFGDVSIGDQRTKQLEIKNQGTTTLNIQNISTNNTAITASPTSVALAPGGSRTVALSYKPQVIRSDNSTLTIASDDLDEGNKQVSLSANGVSDLDLTLQRLEVNQAIQTLDQSVPLVEAKKTVLRAYIGSSVVGGSVRDITNVDGVLRVYQNGVDLTPGSVIRPTDTITVYPYPVDGSSEPTLRSTLTRTLNFILPPWATVGSFTYKVEVNPASGRVARIDEHDYSNNTLSIGVTYTPRRQPQIAYIPINYTVGSLGLPEEDLMIKNTEQFRKMFPISSFEYLRRPPITFSLDVRWISNPDGSGNYTNTTELLNAIFTAENLRTRGRPAEKVIGWLPSKTYVGGYMQFPWCYSCRNGVVGTSKYGDSAFAHELGHGYDFPHPDHYLECNRKDLDPLFPPDTGLEIFGSDIKIKTRKQWADFMSYCSPGWIPVDKYRTLFNEFDPTVPPKWSSPGGGSSPSALISGYMTADGKASLFPIYEADAAPELIDNQTTTTDYSLKALNTSHQTLWEIPLEISFNNALEDNGDMTNIPSFFSFVVPLTDEMGSIQVVDKEGEVLAEKKRSHAAPTLRLVKPDGSKNFGDTLNVEWEAQDADQDPLQFSVLLSHDGGSTFEVIGANLKQTEFHYDVSQIQGGQNKVVQIVATDGMNTSSVNSATFSIASKPPTLILITPQDQETFNVGSPVPLEVSALDPEDGTLPTSSILWGSDPSGKLGTGPNLLVDNLPIGLHVITVTAEDSDQNKVSQSVTIRVVDIAKSPKTEAGPGQEADEGETVMLDGSESSDPNTGDILSYDWQQIDGPQVTLSDPGDVHPTFVVPSVDADSALRFRLTVSDQDGNEATDTVEVAIANVYFPLMKLSSSEIDFGVVNTGRSIEKKLIVANEGNEKLVVTNVKTSNGVFKAVPATFEVEPGKSSEVTISFTPDGPAIYAANVEMVSNTKPGVPTTILLKGETPTPQIVKDDNSAGGSLISQPTNLTVDTPTSAETPTGSEEITHAEPPPQPAQSPPTGEESSPDQGSFGVVGIGGCSLIHE